MKVISLYTGIGGLDHGFSQVGFDVVLCVDNSRLAKATYLHNSSRLWGTEPEYQTKDVFDIEQFPKADIVIAGPPCQSWSKGNSTFRFDDRGSALFRTASIINDVRPKVFVVENVPGLLQEQKRPYLDAWLGSFQGYRTETRVLDFNAYGVPQRRKRLVVIGTLKGDPARFFPLPGKGRGTNVIQGSGTGCTREMIGSALGKVGESFLRLEHFDRYDLQLRQERKVTRILCKLNTTSGKDVRMLEALLTQYLDVGHRALELTETIFAFKSGEVSPTVALKGGANTFVCEGRKLGLVDYARLQGLDNYEFPFGSERAKLTLISNAVPPPFSVKLAKQIKRNI